MHTLELELELLAEAMVRARIKGSSSSNTKGLFTMARAMATRCCCPPESWCGMRISRPVILTMSRASET